MSLAVSPPITDGQLPNGAVQAARTASASERERLLSLHDPSKAMRFAEMALENSDQFIRSDGEIVLWKVLALGPQYVHQIRKIVERFLINSRRIRFDDQLGYVWLYGRVQSKEWGLDNQLTLRWEFVGMAETWVHWTEPSYNGPSGDPASISKVKGPYKGDAPSFGGAFFNPCPGVLHSEDGSAVTFLRYGKFGQDVKSLTLRTTPIGALGGKYLPRHG